MYRRRSLFTPTGFEHFVNHIHLSDIVEKAVADGPGMQRIGIIIPRLLAPG